MGLVDNSRALVSQHDPEGEILVFAERLEKFARYWDFKPRACLPYRARTKGKDELEAHLVRWTREVADVRIHGTTGEAPLERFEREAARSLEPAAASREGVRELRVVRSSELARSLAVYAEVIGEMAA